jgi:hypothetical protein
VTLAGASLLSAGTASVSAATGYAAMDLLASRSRPVFGPEPIVDRIAIYFFMACVVFVAALLLGMWAHTVLRNLHIRSKRAYAVVGSALGGGTAAFPFLHLPADLRLLSIGLVAWYAGAGWLAAVVFWHNYMQPSTDSTRAGRLTRA